MRAALIALTAALGLVDASVNVLTPSWALNKRQAFDPGEDTGVGETCVEAFGPGYVECRPESASQNALCISPAEGHTCCNNEWGCPADSFCLVDGLCCPTGLDPQTCAQENGVDLPADFGRTTSAPRPTTTTSRSARPTATEEDDSTATEDADTTTARPTTTRAPTGGAGGNNTASRTSTGSGRPTVTAGAAREGAGVAAVVLGLAAAMAL